MKRIFLALFPYMVILPSVHAQLMVSNQDLQDDPDKEWSYLKKSTTVIGVPYQPDVTQVTYDGALYTRYAELCFFFGQNRTPLLARQKTFHEGWIPVVEYDWIDGNIAYHIRLFAAPLEGHGPENTVNFIKVSMKNAGNEDASGCFTAAMRGKLSDYRFDTLKDFSLESSYEMTDNAMLRDGQLVYTFDREAQKEAVRGVNYTKPFNGKDYHIDSATVVGLTNYRMKLSPGQTATLIYKMPRVPVPLSDSVFIKQIHSSDYDHYLAKTIDYWKNFLDSHTRFEIPEKRIHDAQKASLVHLLLATRTKDNHHKTQTDGLPYPNFFLTSSPQMIMAYLVSGIPDLAKLSVLNALRQQEMDGLYFDRSLAHGGIIPAAHGHILYGATAYYLYTRDKETAKKIYPSLQKAIGFLEKSMKENQYGLMPPTYPYDNEMIDGHYTSTNLWTLLGLRFAIRMARDLGKPADVTHWEALAETYASNILRGVEASAKADGYVPPGLYAYLTGKKARRGFEEYRTNCDWENMLLSYPTELLPPNDPKVKGTLDHVRKSYAEGIMTYRHGQHLHQYITANLIEQYMVRGEPRQALIDFYHLILHSGSTHEGFENLVEPWKDRQVDPHCPPPHAWAAGKMAFLIRNFLVHEFGGTCGLQLDKRDLYLFSVISPSWAKAGEKIAIHNAPTEFGIINASMNFSEGGARIRISSDFHTNPGTLKIRIPYFKRLVDFKTDAKQSSVLDGCIVLSPEATYVDIRWEELPDTHRGTFEDLLVAYRSTHAFEGVDSIGGAIIRHGKPFLQDQEKQNEIQPLSFDLIKQTFLYEFDRRKSVSYAQAQWDFATTYFKIRVDGKGYITSMKNSTVTPYKEFSPADKPSPLMRLYDGEKKVYYEPTSANYNEADSIMTLGFTNGSTAQIHLFAQEKYIRLELRSLSPRNGIEGIQWGPYHTGITNLLGEIIGVARDTSDAVNYAIGMLALDDNTLGGMSSTVGDAAPFQYIIHTPDAKRFPLPDHLQEGQVFSLGGDGISDVAFYAHKEPFYRIMYGNAAQVDKQGRISISYHSRDRSLPRTVYFSIIPNMEANTPNHIDVQPLPGVDFIGSSVALWGSPDSTALMDVIQDIVLKEELPYPTINGKWVKDPAAFVPDAITHGGLYDSIVSYTARLGFHAISLYDQGFLRPDRGNSGYIDGKNFEKKPIKMTAGAISHKALAEQAAEYGIIIGRTTITNSLAPGTKDASPVPSDSLCYQQRRLLTKSIDPTDTLIYVDDPTHLEEIASWEGHCENLNMVKIGKELIHYLGVTDQPPYRLLNVKRGYWNTAPANHHAGDTIDKLQVTINYGYDGLIPNIQLQDKIAEYYADVCHINGLAYYDFDGQEFLFNNGHGYYSVKRFFRKMFERAEKLGIANIRFTGATLSEGSWHYQSIWNVGGGKNLYDVDTREWGSATSQGKDLRDVTYANFFPVGMGGNFPINATSTVEQYEHIQAISVGVGTTYSLYLNQQDVESCPQKEAIFKVIRTWEDARAANAFPRWVKKRLADPAKSWKLEAVGDNNTWRLYDVTDGHPSLPITLSRSIGY